MRLCDDCIYKNNCKEYQNKVIKTTPIDFDFFGCSDYRAESSDVFTRKEEKGVTKEVEFKVINRGKCMLCGKELTEGLFFCKECEDKGKAVRNDI